MSNLSGLSADDMTRTRVSRVHRYCLMRLNAVTALQIIHFHVFPTRAGQHPSMARPAGAGSGDQEADGAEVVSDDEDFLRLLASLHASLRAWSTDLVLPTAITELWSDLMQAVRSGDRIRERAEALCKRIESDFNINVEEILHLNGEMKILTVGRQVYDASGCYAASRILEYYYIHRDRIVRPDEIRIRIFENQITIGRIKELFESLPEELRGLVKPIPGAGRTWCG